MMAPHSSAGAVWEISGVSAGFSSAFVGASAGEVPVAGASSTRLSTSETMVFTRGK